MDINKPIPRANLKDLSTYLGVSPLELTDAALHVGLPLDDFLKQLAYVEHVNILANELIDSVPKDTPLPYLLAGLCKAVAKVTNGIEDMTPDMVIKELTILFDSMEKAKKKEQRHG